MSVTNSLESITETDSNPVPTAVRRHLRNLKWTGLVVGAAGVGVAIAGAIAKTPEIAYLGMIPGGIGLGVLYSVNEIQGVYRRQSS